MGKVENGLMLGVRGKVGPIVMSKGKNGISIMGIKKVKTSKPPKQLQISQRTKFAVVAAFVGDLKRVIDIGFQGNTDGLEPFAAALQYNLLNAVTGVYPDFKMDYPNVKLSKGNLPGSNTLILKNGTGGELTITWGEDDGFGEEEAALRSEDTTMLVVYDPLHDRFYFNNAGSTRGKNLLVGTVPRVFAGGLLHAWFFFVSPDKLRVSKTEYLGSFAITV